MKLQSCVLWILCQMAPMAYGITAQDFVAGHYKLADHVVQALNNDKKAEVVLEQMRGCWSGYNQQEKELFLEMINQTTEMGGADHLQLLQIVANACEMIDSFKNHKGFFERTIPEKIKDSILRLLPYKMVDPTYSKLFFRALQGSEQALVDISNLNFAQLRTSSLKQKVEFIKNLQFLTTELIKEFNRIFMLKLRELPRTSLDDYDKVLNELTLQHKVELLVIIKRFKDIVMMLNPICSSTEKIIVTMHRHHGIPLLNIVDFKYLQLNLKSTHEEQLKSLESRLLLLSNEKLVELPKDKQTASLFYEQILKDFKI